MATPLAFPGQSSAPTTITVTMEGNQLLADHRVFSSGSTGYHASGKVIIGGARYQVSCSVVLIGSKPARVTPAVTPTTKPATK